MKHLTTFLIALLILGGCGKRPEAPKEVVIPGIIPEAVLQQAQQKYGVFARNRFEAYNAKLIALQERPVEAKLEAVNDFFNQVPHGEDIDVWGVEDYWATPLEFLGKDRGDCEDYVIAKYFTLVDLGIDPDKLYFSYVKSLRFNTEHMVLSYFETPDAVPLVLDNTNYKIFPADLRRDLQPVYNFNRRSFYRADPSGRNGERVVSSRKNYLKWDRLLNDVKNHKL